MKDSCQVRQALRRSIWDGVFANLYAGLTGGIFLAGYALALHASEVQIGLLASFPLIANLAQPFSTYAISRLGRRRPLALVSAAAARLSWLGLIGASVYMSASPELLLLSLGLVAISQIGTAVNNLVWMSWMADLVREEFRGRYFGSRNAALGVATLVATLAGGYALDVWKESHPGGELYALRGLFFIGVVCGLVSLLIQARIHEPRLQEADTLQPFRQRFWQPFQDTNFRRFLVFTLVWNFGVYCAAPFFAVYMLKTLELSYTAVAAYATLSSLANLLSVRLWGRVADRATNKTVLLLAGILVAGVPVGWMWAAPQTWLLIAVLHVQGGLCWAGIHLCASNLVLKLAPAANRSIYIATFNAGASLMVMCASLLGGLALQYLPDLLRLYELAWSPFWVVFGASASLRIAALPLLARVTEPSGRSVWQTVPVFRNVRAFTTTMGFNPNYHFWLRGKR